MNNIQNYGMTNYHQNFCSKVPVKKWKTVDGKQFVNELKEIVPDTYRPRINQFKTRESKLPNGYMTYQTTSGGNLPEITEDMLEINKENIMKKICPSMREDNLLN